MVNSMLFVKGKNHLGFCGQAVTHDPWWYWQVYMGLTTMHQPIRCTWQRAAHLDKATKVLHLGVLSVSPLLCCFHHIS